MYGEGIHLASFSFPTRNPLATNKGKEKQDDLRAKCTLYGYWICVVCSSRCCKKHHCSQSLTLHCSLFILYSLLVHILLIALILQRNASRACIFLLFSLSFHSIVFVVLLIVQYIVYRVYSVDSRYFTHAFIHFNTVHALLLNPHGPGQASGERRA